MYFSDPFGNYLLEKVDNKYQVFPMPYIGSFFCFTGNDKIVGINGKNYIYIFDCKSKELLSLAMI